MSSSRLVPELALVRCKSRIGDGWLGMEDHGAFGTGDWGPSLPLFVMCTNSPDSGMRVPPGVRRGTYRIPVCWDGEEENVV